MTSRWPTSPPDAPSSSPPSPSPSAPASTWEWWWPSSPTSPNRDTYSSCTFPSACPWGARQRSRNPPGRRKFYLGDVQGMFFPPLSLLSSRLFTLPFAKTLVRTRELLGGGARVTRGNRETGSCFFGRSPVYISLTLSPAVNLLTSGLDFLSFFFDPEKNHSSETLMEERKTGL